MFTLNPNPTFKADVTIPTPSGDGVIEIEYKHKGRKALKAYYDSLSEGAETRSDKDSLSELIVGWGKIDVEYSEDALETFLDNYPAAAQAIFAAYNKALLDGKQKNS